MNIELTRTAIEAVSRGVLDRQLSRLVDAAAHVAQMSGAMLTVRRNNEDIVLISRGMPYSPDQHRFRGLPGTDVFFDGPVFIADVTKNELLAAHPLATQRPFWRSVAIMPVHLPGADMKMALTCGDAAPSLLTGAKIITRLQRIAAVIADEIELVGELAVLEAQVRCEQQAHSTLEDLPLLQYSTAKPVDSPGVVSSFLLTTLIAQKRLLRRGPVPYHALYRWRRAVKDVQIASLKALKRDPGDVFLDTVANYMAAAASELFGSGTIAAVVPVPCGNSGKNCLSASLAQLIAERLGVQFLDAFEPLPQTGGSHPKNNLRRPAMRLKIKPTVPVLLIDDVATSGVHIAEAAQLLRQTAPAVLPLVWIAD